MVQHHGLAQFVAADAVGPQIQSLLDQRTCIQLDPLSVIGTNADLVVLARIKNAKIGDVYRHLLPHHAFEHFAKERCLLPARAFPHYRKQAVETPWWRHSERMKRLPASVLDAVESEIRERGPLTARELTDHGGVEPLNWNGWKSTSKATSLALEILWVRCRIVVTERTPAGKRYDIPERALPAISEQIPEQEFFEWAVEQRVHAAGMLAEAGGPHWSMLRDARRNGLADTLVAKGRLEKVRIEGRRRSYYIQPGFFDQHCADADDEIRVIGPLDSLIWDRNLIRYAFGFDYVWEVYKPVQKRQFGWYVCPLLHRGKFVGRIDAYVECSATSKQLVVRQVWPEPNRPLDKNALDRALHRHANALGVTSVEWKK